MYLSLTGKVVVFGVDDHREVKVDRVFHAVLHQTRILDALTVVRDGDDASAFHGRHLREFLSFELLGHCADDVDFAVSEVFRSALDVFDGRDVIHDRLGIGHGADAGVAAFGCGAGSGDDVFFIGLSGVSEVAMRIDESGQDVLALGVDDCRVFVLYIRGDLEDHFVLDEDVLYAKA